MAKYHINPSSGDPSQCRARAGNCPFGSDDEHYGSSTEARVAYEEQMQAKTSAVANQVPSTFNMKQLNDLAKSTSSPLIQEEVVKRGSERTLKNFAKNKKAKGELLLKANERASSQDTKKALVLNENYPTEALTDDEFGEVLEAEEYWSQRTRQLLESDRVNDAIADKVKADGRVAHCILRNPNQISPKKYNEICESNYRLIGEGLKAGRYPLGERVDELDPDLLQDISVWCVDYDLSNTPEFARRVRQLGDTHSAHFLAMNPTLSEESVEDVAQVLSDPASEDIIPSVLISVYSHPNASTKTKARLESLSPQVRSAAKLEKLGRQYPEGLKKELTRTDVASKTDQPFRNRGLYDSTTYLDVNKIQALGLTRDDVMVMMGSSQYNGGSSYDEATGAFRGTIDSTD